jgi:serine/threonine protein phosphatase PrpC
LEKGCAVQIYSRTHKGLVRSTNQDAILMKDTLFGVADGMGGHLGGDTASKLAMQVIDNMLSNKSPAENTLRIGVEAANRRVYERQRFDLSLKGMGTTLTLLWEGETTVLIAHVGDSRAYLLRDGKLIHVTDDHSVVGEMLRNKEITPEEAKTHPYRNVITRAIGTGATVEMDLIQAEKHPGDIWLICSDGLYNKVEDHEMEDVLRKFTAEDAVEKLLQMTLERGAEDNVSILLGYDSEGSEA